jgi:hypothetical protein
MDSVRCRNARDLHPAVSASSILYVIFLKPNSNYFELYRASQTRKLGIKRLRTDDWLIITVIPWYTLLVVSINRIIIGGGSNYMTPEDIAALTPQTKADRISGSKWVLVSEEVMVLCVWTCKICMLLIYRRLT